MANLKWKTYGCVWTEDHLFSNYRSLKNKPWQTVTTLHSYSVQEYPPLWYPPFWIRGWVVVVVVILVVLIVLVTSTATSKGSRYHLTIDTRQGIIDIYIYNDIQFNDIHLYIDGLSLLFTKTFHVCNVQEIKKYIYSLQMSGTKRAWVHPHTLREIQQHCGQISAHPSLPRWLLGKWPLRDPFRLSWSSASKLNLKAVDQILLIVNCGFGESCCIQHTSTCTRTRSAIYHFQTHVWYSYNHVKEIIPG